MSATAKPALAGPALAVAEYTLVAGLDPNSQGLNFVARVHSVDTVAERTLPDGTKMRAAEVLLGDETGCVVLTAKDGQLDVLVPGAPVVIRNSRAAVFGGFLRMSVDKFGKVSAHPDGVASTPAAPTVVKLDNNLSAEEYMLES